MQAQRVDEAINLFKLAVPKTIAQADRDHMLSDINVCDCGALLSLVY